MCERCACLLRVNKAWPIKIDGYTGKVSSNNARVKMSPNNCGLVPFLPSLHSANIAMHDQQAIIKRDCSYVNNVTATFLLI